VNWIELTVGIPQLSSQDKQTGDISGTAVEISVDIQSNGGGFVPQSISGRFEGKCMSRYQRTYRLPLTGTAPWEIRITRLTADAPDSALNNTTFWDSFTECVDVKLNYTNTAAVMLTTDAENFQAVPTRGYDIKGLRIRIPTNYDPLTRIYSGAWDGSFKIAWSDNPAWCFFDMLSNERYGLGGYLDIDQIDKWSLYQIGRYCDELVPDGFGGTESRFTCNLYMQTREDAYKVINAMASIFRGMAFWTNGQIMASQDAPRDPVALFSAANAIDGLFTYQGADRRARHTVALISWNDPDDMYRQKIEYVQDDDAVVRWGVIETEVLAVGCTSRGQAHRIGKWILFTEQNESEVVTFRAGMDAALVMPGDVISIQDSVRSGKRFGGRIMSGTTSSLTIDAPVSIEAGQTYEVSIVMPSGGIETRALVNAVGSTSVLNLSAPLSTLPGAAAIWVVSASNLVPEQWRILSVAEAEPTIVEIAAVYYHPGKYVSVEQDLDLELIPTSTLPKRPGIVTNLVAHTELYKVNDGSYSTRVSVSWTASEHSSSYIVAWKRDSENYKSQESLVPNFDIDNVSTGTYTIKITPKNSLGISGVEAVISHTVGATGSAPDVQNLRANPDFTGRDLPLIWDAVAGAISYEVEIRDPATNVLSRTETVTPSEYVYTDAKNKMDHGISSPKRSLKVRVRANSLIGVSPNWAEGIFTNPIPNSPTATAVGGLFQVMIHWAFTESPVDVLGVEVWWSVSNNRAMAMRLSFEAYPSMEYNHVGLSVGQGGYYWVRAVSTSGGRSAWFPSGDSAGMAATATSDPTSMLLQLNNALGISELSSELAIPITIIGDLNSIVGQHTDALFEQVLSVDGMNTHLVDYYYTKANVDGAIALKATELRTYADTAVGDLGVVTEARVTNLESTKIGYATLNATGETFDDNGAILDKAGTDAWNLANPGNQATWHVGIPLASAIKQVMVSDGKGGVAKLQDTYTAVVEVDGKLSAKRGLKVDVNGHVTGMEIANDGTSGSFIVLADKFAIVRPDGTGAPVPMLSLGTVNGVTALGLNGNLIVDGSIAAKSVAAYSITADKINGTNLNVVNGTFSGTLAAGTVDFASSVGYSTVYDTPGTYSFTLPPGMRAMRLTLVGAGAGGAAGQMFNTSGSNCSAGGGGGGVSQQTFTGLTPGASFTLVVGAGGTGGPMVGQFGNWWTATNGAAGGNTSVLGYLTANGGGGTTLYGYGNYTSDPGAGGYGNVSSGKPGLVGGDIGTLVGSGGASGGIYGAGGLPGYPGGNGSGYGGGGAGGQSHISGIDISTAGGNGSGGYALVEMFDPNGVILQSTYDILLSALARQNIGTV
jgi:predicted phage tail protein